MNRLNFVVLCAHIVLLIGCASPSRDQSAFPAELVNFAAYENNPVFAGTGADTWDEAIRERGFILREEDGYHLWYTGHSRKQGDTTIHLGYATSPDGLHWMRHKDNPVFAGSWTEDVMVLKRDSLYYMFAEGLNDVAHMLTSTNKIDWKDHGSLQVRSASGQPLSPGPYGTPSVLVENDVWYLFYERNDSAVWLAASTDLKLWTNVQDEPVLNKGPETYDRHGVAANQVIKYGDSYYMYYHGTPFPDWHEWNTNVAVSTNLVDWKKFGSNPIMEENKSSGILVYDGSAYRLYTMHEEVCVHFPAQDENVR